MGEDGSQKEPPALRGKSHMPVNSVFFDKVVPILLVALGVVMAGLVLFAAGVVLGLIKF